MPDRNATEANPMSGVFQNIDPSHSSSVYPPAFGAGEGHTRWVERGCGVNTKTKDIALYYVSTLCCAVLTSCAVTSIFVLRIYVL